MNHDREVIIRTIIWFHIFDIAPTLMEIFQWQMKPNKVISLARIKKVLDDLISDGIIKEYDNFFALKTADSDIFHNRLHNYFYSYRKQRKILPYIKYLNIFYNIKSINFCNTRLPFHASKDKSDIDLFITATPNSLWSIRFFSLFPLRILRRRPGEVPRDAIDISFIMNHQNLSFSQWFDYAPEYFATWILSLENITGNLDIISSNSKVKDIFPNKQATIRINHRRVKDYKFIPSLSLLEDFLKKLQFRILPEKIKYHIDQQSIAIDENYIKLHLTDKSAEYCALYNKLCVEYKISS